jgi:hypothetical protein
MLEQARRRFVQAPKPRARAVPNNDEPITLKFRCPAELHGKLPPPIPATLGLPAWLKAMPMQAFNAINMREEDTIKRCPPFVDAMTCGFLIPLICDLRIENGSIAWDNDIPPAERWNSRARPSDFMTQARSSARHCSSLTDS